MTPKQAANTIRGDDYIDRTIETVRIHRDADNCWPQWANLFADEIERLRVRAAAADTLADAARFVVRYEGNPIGAAKAQVDMDEAWDVLAGALAAYDAATKETTT